MESLMFLKMQLNFSVCAKGYTDNGGSCGPCSIGYYKDVVGNGACSNCTDLDSNSTTVGTGSENSTFCGMSFFLKLPCTIFYKKHWIYGPGGRCNTKHITF